MTEITFVGCPMCGKFTPRTIATFKAGDPQQYFIVQKRLCAGAHGFKKMDETYFVENLDDADLIVLANELFDMSSGLVISALENKLPLHRPAILLRLDKLIEENKELRAKTLPLLEKEQIQKLAFDLQTANKNLSILIPRYKDVKNKNANLILANDHLQKENDKLKQEKEDDDSADIVFRQEAEISSLKVIIEHLEKDIKKCQDIMLAV